METVCATGFQQPGFFIGLGVLPASSIVQPILADGEKGMHHGQLNGLSWWITMLMDWMNSVFARKATMQVMPTLTEINLLDMATLMRDQLDTATTRQLHTIPLRVHYAQLDPIVQVVGIMFGTVPHATGRTATTSSIKSS